MNDPVRVLYVSHTAEMSGAEYSLLELIGALGDRIDPIVASPPGPLERELGDRAIPRLEIEAIEGGSLLHPVHTTQALRAITRGGRRLRRTSAEVDLIHGNLVRAGLIGAVAARRATPLIVHLRDAAKPTPTWAAARRLVGARASAVIANSRYTAEHFVYRGFRPPVHVIPSPVDLTRFEALPPREETRAALGLAADDFALGVIAMLSPHKGQETAVRALARVRESLPSARLLLVGSAKWTTSAATHDNARYAEELRALAAELGEGAVLFTGERADVPAVMSALDLVLVPSWHEPWGRTVIEAMAAGTPVVASAVGGPTESIEHGRSGLLVEPRDPDAWASTVLELAADPDRRRDLAARARERVDRWHVDRHAEQVLEVYRAALAASSSA